MAIVKKPVKKTTPVSKDPGTKNPDDFDNNPATIMRNGGKVKKKAMGGKVMPKKSMGGKMKKCC